MNDRAGRKIHQSGVIPLRTVSDGLEVLLITTSDGRRWSIPKGTIEPDLTPAESAAKEAWEEAGVRGSVDPSPVGEYCYDKSGRVYRFVVFRLEVAEELDAWPEQHFRRRQWVSLAEALVRVKLDSLRSLLQSFIPSTGSSRPATADSDAS